MAYFSISWKEVRTTKCSVCCLWGICFENGNVQKYLMNFSVCCCELSELWAWEERRGSLWWRGEDWQPWPALRGRGRAPGETKPTVHGARLQNSIVTWCFSVPCLDVHWQLFYLNTAVKNILCARLPPQPEPDRAQEKLCVYHSAACV